MSSRPDHVTTKDTFPYWINQFCRIEPRFCEGVLRNLDPIQNDLFSLTLYAVTLCPILWGINYLRCKEGGATKFMSVHTPPPQSPDRRQAVYWRTSRAIEGHPQQFLRCNLDLCPRALAACCAYELDFLKLFPADPQNSAQTLSLNITKGPQFRWRHSSHSSRHSSHFSCLL